MDHTLWCTSVCSRTAVSLSAVRLPAHWLVHSGLSPRGALNAPLQLVFMLCWIKCRCDSQTRENDLHLNSKKKFSCLCSSIASHVYIVNTAADAFQGNSNLKISFHTCSAALNLPRYNHRCMMENKCLRQSNRTLT